MPAIDAVVTWDEQARTGLLLAVNRDANTPHTLTIDLSGLPGLPGLGTLALGKAQLLHEDDPYRTNTAEAPEAVTPQPLGIAMNATASRHLLDQRGIPRLKDGESRPYQVQSSPIRPGPVNHHTIDGPCHSLRIFRTMDSSGAGQRR